MTRGGWACVEIRASNSGSTVSPETNSSTGSMPASSAAWTRSSPSQTKSPSFSRWRRDSRSRWISRSFGFVADVIIGPVRILAYNVWDGGGDRLGLIADVIRGQRPDAVALTETTSAFAAALARGLRL